MLTGNLRDEWLYETDNEGIVGKKEQNLAVMEWLTDNEGNVSNKEQNLTEFEWQTDNEGIFRNCIAF